MATATNGVEVVAKSTATSIAETTFQQSAVDHIRAAEQSGACPPPPDPRFALQGFLLMDSIVRLTIWSASLVLATLVMNAMSAWPNAGLLGQRVSVTVAWGIAAAKWVGLFNLAYVMQLAIWRSLIPTPKPGIYSTVRPPDIRKRSDRQLIYASFVATLTKARYEAPFPGFLVFQIANTVPMCWIMGRVFGPKTKSCYITDPVILDPYLVEIGRNVVIGSGANIAGHCQLPDMVALRKTIIEDDVVIGANSTIFGGVQLKRGCMIGAGSVVPPFTVVGPSEYWSGVPAVKIRDLPPPQHLQAWRASARVESPKQ